MTIRIEDLHVDVGGFSLDGINLSVATGEYLVLLGPTGAGKTILLETIAGLNRPKKGTIWLLGRNITSLAPERRGISIVYQDQALFPHLTIADNVAFGLKCRRKTAAERVEAVRWVSGLMKIDHLLQRKPNTLSGGERQKVAMARALAVRPAVLLLDEPLSAIDADSREAMQDELKRLHRLFETTIIHVTHSFEEAIALGDRVAVLGEGRLHQVGTPEDVFRRPESMFVARFAMSKNIFDGTVTRSGGNAQFSTGGIAFRVPEHEEGTYHASIRPEDITVSMAPVDAVDMNCLAGEVARITDRGAFHTVAVSLPPEIICLLPHGVVELLHLWVGQKVYVTFRTSAVHLFN